MPDNLISMPHRELTLWVLTFMVLISLVILVPQLLRVHLRKLEMDHLEHLKALELGITLPMVDDRPKVAGRMALLVPMVVMITAGTVTCFLAIYNIDTIFPVTLSVWVVAGVVSLASITAGVALVSRLANLSEFAPEEEDAPKQHDNDFSETYPR